MKLVLMKTIPGKEDHELPLLHRISFLEWPASKTTSFTAHRGLFEFKQRAYFNIHWSEETARVRPLWSNCGKETINSEEQQGEETCLGQQTQEINIVSVENCPFIWWVQIWDFWFRCREGKQTVPECVIANVKHDEGWWSRGVMVWAYFAGYTVGDLVKNWVHTYLAFSGDMPSHLVCTQWDHNLFYNCTMIPHTPPGYVRRAVIEW